MDDIIRVLHEDVSNPTTEQCMDSSKQSTKASHMDSVGLKEAEFEVQCRTQQEQIEMLQQQLLEAQNQLKEQAVKHRQDQETLNMEISELKSQVCCNKALHDMKVETLGREQPKRPTLKSHKSKMNKIPPLQMKNLSLWWKKTLENRTKKKRTPC